MNTNKFNLWIIGLCLFFAGATLIYLEGYKNNNVIEAISCLLVFGGWQCLFIKAIKGTIIDMPKISFKTDKAGFFKQRIISFFAYTISIGAMVASIFWFNDMGQKRRADILQNQPTNTAVAVVDHIDVRHGRSSTSYYAVFQYVVNGKLISHPWHEKHESDFLVGQKIHIKYSVAHPDMFMILNTLP